MRGLTGRQWAVGRKRGERICEYVCHLAENLASDVQALFHSGGRAAAALSCQRIFILRKQKTKRRGEKKREEKEWREREVAFRHGWESSCCTVHPLLASSSSFFTTLHRVSFASRSSAVVPSALHLPHSRRSPVLLAGSSPIFAFYFRPLPFVFCKRTNSILVTWTIRTYFVLLKFAFSRHNL